MSSLQKKKYSKTKDEDTLSQHIHELKKFTHRYKHKYVDINNVAGLFVAFRCLLIASVDSIKLFPLVRFVSD